MTSEEKKNKLILVVGATGNQGSAVCEQLFANGFSVRAMTRHKDSDKAQSLAQQGAELVEADLEDGTSLDKALDGVYEVFAVLRFFQEDQHIETEQGIRLTEAAEAAGVQHFIYSSVASAHRKTGVPHLDSKWEIEQHLRRTDLPYTIFGPSAFNYSMQEFQEAVQQGIVPYAFDPETIIFQTDETDYAKHVVMALDNPHHWQYRRYDVISDSFPAGQLANIFSEVVGFPVKYQQVSWEQQTETAGQETVNLMQWIERIGPDIYVPARRREHPWLTSFRDYLQRTGWNQLEKKA